MEEIDRYVVSPPDSINRHRVRVLRAPDGRRFLLDRTTDCAPPFFTAYEAPEETSSRIRIMRAVRVDGQEYWGESLSWPKAIRKLAEAVASA